MRQAACGYHEYWPHGRGIFQARDKQFNMWINEGDHLLVMVMLENADINFVLSKLKRGVEGVGKAVGQATESEQLISRHPIIGMVRYCPTNLGDALLVRLMCLLYP